MLRNKIITPAVLLLSLVSLFTDIASEMLYPVMPVFLKSIGFSVLLIGVLEGLAEATAGLSKGYFGHMSDALGRRVPFIRWGYAMSAVSKPMMALFTFPWWIFLARTADRLGKGVRTSARDALLSDEASAATKGRVFGFHRGMDTLGAAMGPLLALAYLWLFPGQYTSLFLLAFFPGFLAVLLTFRLKEQSRALTAAKSGPGIFAFLTYWRSSPAAYKRLITGLLIFTLFNSSDVFLLLHTRDMLGSETGMIGLYVFYNMVYALVAFPIGRLADRMGLKRVLIAGLTIFAAVYFCFGFAGTLMHFVLLFFAYGIYAASTEGISRALISNIAERQETATALGFYSSFSSLFTLLASSLSGFIWYAFSARVMFVTSAIGVLIALLFLAFFLPAQLTTSPKRY